jgi:hypothetical protein
MGPRRILLAAPVAVHVLLLLLLLPQASAVPGCPAAVPVPGQVPECVVIIFFTAVAAACLL